jgi:hypothetical protein
MSEKIFARKKRHPIGFGLVPLINVQQIRHRYHPTRLQSTELAIEPLDHARV